METRDVKATMRILEERIVTDYASFFQEKLSFSWWLRGGEPGSPSDHLSLESASGQVMGKYIRVRFEGDHQPPMYSQEFSGKVDLKDAAQLLKHFFIIPLFQQEDATVGPSDLRDARKESWGFRNADLTIVKVTTEPFPEDVQSLRALCFSVAEKLTTGQ